MTDLRCLTLRQPHPDLIVAGVQDGINMGRPPTWWDLPEWQLCGVRIDDYGHPTGNQLTRWLPGVTHDDTPCQWCEPDGPYPFRLAIHSAEAENEDYHSRAWSEWRHLDLRRSPVYGAILGSVEVTGSHHADDCREPDDNTTPDGVPNPNWRYCSPWAEPDCHHWRLANPRPLDDPIPAKGQAGLWRLGGDVADRLREAAT